MTTIDDPIQIGTFDDLNVGTIRIMRSTVRRGGYEDRHCFTVQDEHGDGCSIGESQAYNACNEGESGVKARHYVGLQLGNWLLTHPPCTRCKSRAHGIELCTAPVLFG